MMFYIFQVAIGLITPLLTFIFLPIFKNHRIQGVLISGFLTSAFVFFTPLDGFDLLVHYQNFIDYQSGHYILFNRYIGVDALIFLVSALGFDKQTLVLITSFFLFYATFKFVEQRVPSNKLLMVFMLVIASYPLVLLISGVRFSLALSFFLLADCFFIKKKYFLYALFSGLAILFHYAASVLVVIYLGARFLQINKLNTKIICIFLLLVFPLVFYEAIFIDIINYLIKAIGFEKYVGLDLSRYVSGEWGAGRSASYNLNGLLGYFLPKILLCIIGFVYLIYNNEKNAFIISLFAIVLLLFKFGDIGDRYAICLMPFLITSLLNNPDVVSVKKIPIALVFIIIFVLLNVFKELLLYGEVYTHIFMSTLSFDSPISLLIGGIQ